MVIQYTILNILICIGWTEYLHYYSKVLSPRSVYLPKAEYSTSEVFYMKTDELALVQILCLHRKFHNGPLQRQTTPNSFKTI